MKEIIFSKHAEGRMKFRGLRKKQVESAIEEPDAVLKGKEGTLIAQKDMGTHILRVIYSDEGKYYLVITAYYADRERYEVKE
ncbi:MAG: DUF4258 domain-containing protein [Thermoplasmata archaeon]